MKLRFASRIAPLALAAVLAGPVSADPILPYQQPIAAQLESDIAGSVGDVKTLNSALNTYHKTSKSISTDTSILRSLDKTLANTPGYSGLIANATDAYQTDFQGRRDALYLQLVPAGISVNKTFARSALVRVDNALSNSVNAATETLRIQKLQTAAGKLISATNAVQKALTTKLGFSSMVARIGSLSFQSSRGSISGAANFAASAGTFNGLLAEEEGGDGTLDISGFNSGAVARGLSLHVEGITSNTPAVYFLGGQNRGFYGVTYQQHEYNFQDVPGLTNGLVTNSFVAIDFIGTNYLLGHFAFVGTNMFPVTATDTNTTASISQGEFQLNLNR